MSDRKKFLWIAGFFLVFYFLPEGNERVAAGLTESIAMMSDYAREHVLLCLIPAFFIAGAISVFISQQSVMKYLGAKAEKWIAYSVASVSGTVLAVCSCTVLPLFAGIYKRGAGLGPATAFLYSGPAINVLAIVLTARVLGLELGIARAVGAVIFSVVIGLLMAAIFGKEEAARQEEFAQFPEEESGRPLWKTVTYMAGMVVFLVFANWAAPKTPNSFWEMIYSMKWILAGAGLAVTVLTSLTWFNKERGGMVQLNMGIRAAGGTPVVWRSPGRRVPSRPPRTRGPYPEPVCSDAGRGQFCRSELFCFDLRSVYVLCYADRGANIAGPYRRRDGQRPGFGTPSCGSGAVIA